MLFAAYALLALVPFPASEPADGNGGVGEVDPAIVVDGARLGGREPAPPRCRPRAGDPFDAVDVPAGLGQQMIAPDEAGRPSLQPDSDPVTGPEVWQRAGTAIGSYVFRAPRDGTPLCIGARSGSPSGWGQLRRVLDARDYRGRHVEFTAWIAARDVSDVRLWLAVGDSVRVMQGGDTSQASLSGTYGWRPVSLTIGPIPRGGEKLSYGFLLRGAGDVWVHEPRLAVVARPDRSGTTPLVRARSRTD